MWRRKSSPVVLLVSVVHIVTTSTVILGDAGAQRACHETSRVLATAPLREPSESVCAPLTEVWTTTHLARRTASITLRRMKLNTRVTILSSAGRTKLTPRKAYFTLFTALALRAIDIGTFLCRTQTAVLAPIGTTECTTITFVRSTALNATRTPLVVAELRTAHCPVQSTLKRQTALVVAADVVLCRNVARVYDCLHMFVCIGA